MDNFTLYRSTLEAMYESGLKVLREMAEHVNLDIELIAREAAYAGIRGFSPEYLSTGDVEDIIKDFEREHEFDEL